MMAKTKPLLLAGASFLLCASFIVLEINRAIAWIASSSSNHNHKQTHSRVFQEKINTKTPVALFATTKKDEDQAEDNTAYFAKRNRISHRQARPTEPTILEETLLSEHANLESLLSRTSEADEDEITGTHLPETQTPENTPLKNRNDAASSPTKAVPYFLQYNKKKQPEFDAKEHTKTVISAGSLLESIATVDRTVHTNQPLGASRAVGLNDDKGEQERDVKEDTSVVDRQGASVNQYIYDFNENLVNVLYAAISFLYPTSSQSNPTAMATSSLSPLLGTEYNEISAPAHTTQPRVLRFEKFYVFETVARIPYFAYLSVLHLRETLGDRRFVLDDQNYKRIETMRTHYAQADNELHHLLIMEALGGNSRGIDRVLAHSMAFCYYWFVVLVFSWNEQAAYHLNEIVEDHAYKTYAEFLTLHEDELRALPVPEIARKYYEADYHKNPYLFKAFCAVSKNPECHSEKSSPRTENQPHELHSLYDVFRNIRDDEKEHWMSLCNLVQDDDMGAVDEANVQGTKGKNQ